EDHDINYFLELPTEEEVRECYHQFHKVTSNSALELSTCGVCTQEISMQQDQPSIINLKDLPNTHSLIPISSHPQHDLYDGLLLEPGGVMVVNDVVHVCICHTCLCDLQSSKNKPPQFSLANNLWIGHIP
ncbi:hypothetical protein L208DRAFT_1537408, partial [Tricholoma matsutake]